MLDVVIIGLGPVGATLANLLPSAELEAVCVSSSMKVRLVPATDPAVLSWLDALQTNVAVVRPDRYLLGTATTVDGVRGLCARLNALGTAATTPT